MDGRFQEVQGRNQVHFQGKEYPLVEGLMMKVSNGGSGNWGTVPMIANDPRARSKIRSRNW